MPYRILADCVVVLHLAFIVFVLLGGLLALRWRWMAWLHLPALVWGVVVELCGWLCPLTPLENWLRREAGETVYAGGFIERYVVPVVYPEELTRELQLLLGGLLALFNVGVYWVVLRRRSRAPGECRPRS